MRLAANIEKLLEQRYYKTGETWDTLVERVVKNVCIDEPQEFKDTMFELIGNRVFIPNSPCLVNAGSQRQGLFACFVVGPTEDTLEDGFETLKDIAFIAKSGGGAGFTGSVMRPKNSPVAGSTHGYSYGPNKYAEMVSFAMDMMTQSGFRKMALMYTLDIEHQDIEEFIDLKQTLDESALYNFNQSAMIGDDWMRRALKPNSNEARLLEKIVKHAWNNGEPGVMFKDTINNNTPYKYSEQQILCSNPCSEQLLPANGSCNLGSINLAHDVFYTNGKFDYMKLADVTRYATQFLDDVGSANHFPTEKLKTWYENNRPIGVGVMGLADAMMRLQLKYGSQESINFTENVMNVIFHTSYQHSEKLGTERGVPTACIEDGNDTGSYRRNITTVSIAPTGSIAMIAGCSHSIEPIFSPSFRRVDERGQEYLYEHPDRHEAHFASAVGHKNTPTWKEQVDIQAKVQEFCDSGVSKTINLPNDATVGDVLQVFVYAWKSGCKGITVYRDGSRQFQILNTVEEPKEEDSLQQSCPSGVCAI